MSSRLKIFAFCCAALLIAKCEFSPRSTIGTTTQQLAVREEPGRVILAWSGPIEKPMRDDIAAAIDKYKADPRRMIIAFNSPGGSVAHGREVMSAIRDASRLRPIDTLVENGAVCASMCVPVYLLGAERLADPAAHFMFHEVSLELPEGPDKGGSELVVNLLGRRTIETLITDEFYNNDIGGQRVNAQWLANMRTRITGRDVWISGQQLTDEGSGVVDRLVQPALK